MKKLFTLLCMTVAVLAVSAQDLVIYQKGAIDPIRVPVESIDYMAVEDDMTELVEMDVINLSRFAFDVSVKMSSKCKRYVIGAHIERVFSEANFVEAAQQTLDETAFFRPYVNGIGTESAVFAERQLGFNSIDNYDSDEKVSLNTLVAIYAEALDGSYKVYTKSFLAPDAVSSSTPTATITTSDITTEDFNFTVDASADCTKIIYGITSPAALNGKAMSAELMLKVSQGLPNKYTGPLSLQASKLLTLQPNSTFYVYAIPIASDGSIGKVVYTTVKTKAVTADGTGQILSASGTLQAEGQYMSITFPAMTFNADAAKVRVMWCSKTDYDSYKNQLVETFVKDANKDRAWTEYDVNALPRALEVYHYGETYYMYAATVDKNGLVSQPQDVLALMGITSPYTTLAKGTVTSSIDFNGTATAVIANPDKEIIYSTYDPTRISETNPYFSIKAGQNLASVVVLRIDIDATDVKKAVEEMMVGYPNFLVGGLVAPSPQAELVYSNGSWTVIGGLQNLSEDPSTVLIKETWMEYYKLVFVTIDTNGRPRILCTYTLKDDKITDFK